MQRNRSDIQKRVFERGMRNGADGHESDFRRRAESAKTLSHSALGLGQRKPQVCPERYPYPAAAQFPLGEPMDIEDVALLLGCSVWTVRQKYLPQGLPHLRASSAGKIVFFREQIIAWILERQRKED
jgi:hypothetical protein